MLARGTPTWLVAIPIASAVCASAHLIWGFISLLIVSGALIVLYIPVALFFRDPERKIGSGVVSPADGRVRGVEAKGDWVTVSIFMNVHNVHVNRAPWKGTIRSVEHIKGSHVPAFDKESDGNERVRIGYVTENGTWEITQIAGTVARRIIPYVSEGEVLEKGDRFGMIRFGSRVDLRFRLPAGHRVMVSEGDRVLAGKTDLSG